MRREPPFDVDYPVASIDEDEGVVVGWEIDEYTEEIHYYPYPYPIFYGYEDALSVSSYRSSGGGGAPSGTAYGVGCSMARFLTYDEYLYLLDSEYNLKVVDIASIDTPSVVHEKYVGWGLETMFIYNDYMYIGSVNGMYILTLEDPEQPATVSTYSHVTSCDPVVVSGNTAYVTLRSGNTCGGTADLLDVIDITNKSNPKQLASYTMKTPYGLGISDKTLFICQGDNGLVVYDATNPLTIKDNKLAEFSDIKATDVIPVNDVLFTIGDDGFLIYDYSDLENISLLATIEVGTE